MKSLKLQNPHTKQRSDIALSLSIANALIEVVLSGQNLFPEGGLQVSVPDSEGELIPLKISRGTLNSWITRRNTIPETGETLHAVLERAKEEYRVKNTELQKQKLIAEAKKRLHRAIKLRTSQVVRNMFGQVMTREDGSVVRKENVALLKVQIDAIKFVLERLNPEVYGKNQEKVVVNTFSLADLRREHNRQKSQE